MANDTVTLNSGTGGVELAMSKNASDEYYQRIKIVAGADASDQIIAGATADVTLSAGCLAVTLPTDGGGTVGLNAGSNTIGTVNCGTFATVAATSPFTLEDTASTAGEMLTKLGAIRKATPADTSGADGDWEGLQLDNGKLWCQVGGSVAHDAAVGSNDNPVLLGGVAYETDGTGPGTAVAEGDISRLKTTLDGQLMVSGSHPNAFTAIATGSTATTTVLKTAPGAGLHIYITDVIFGAGGIQQLKLTEDSAGSPVDKVELVYLAANNSWSHSFATPIRCTENVNLAVISAQAQAYSCTVSGYIAP